MSGISIDLGDPYKRKTSNFTKIILLVSGVGAIAIIAALLLLGGTPEEQPIITEHIFNISVDYDTVIDKGSHNQRYIKLNFDCGDTIENINDLQFVVNSPLDNPLYLQRTLVTVDKNVKSIADNDVLYFYVGNDNKFHISKKEPSFENYIDLINGDWEIMIDDVKHSKPLSAYTITIKDSKTIVLSETDVLKTYISKASSYDTLLLQSGKYKERIVIDKPIRLLGIDSVILDGGNIDKVIYITAKNVVVENIEICNSGGNSFDSGGIVIETDYTTIKNVIVHHCYNGIWVFGGAYNKITDNTVYSCDVNGIYIENRGTDNSIRKNTVYGNKMRGIYLSSGSDHNYIIDNVVYSNKGYGIYIENYMFLDNVCEYNNMSLDTNYCNDAYVREDLYAPTVTITTKPTVKW